MPAPARALTAGRRNPLGRGTIDAMSAPAGAVVPLSALLAHTRPAYGPRTWAGAVDVLMRDDVFSQVVTDLLTDMDAGVAIREPVRVQRRRGQRILNGMHRTVAHVLAGRGTILATTTEDPAPMQIVEIDATLVGLTSAVRSELADLDVPLDAWMPMASMPLDGAWAELAFMSSRNRTTTVSWYAPHAATEQLLDACRARAAARNCDIVVHDLRLTDSEADSESD